MSDNEEKPAGAPPTQPPLHLAMMRVGVLLSRCEEARARVPHVVVEITAAEAEAVGVVLAELLHARQRNAVLDEIANPDAYLR